MIQKLGRTVTDCHSNLVGRAYQPLPTHFPLDTVKRGFDSNRMDISVRKWKVKDIGFISITHRGDMQTPWCGT